MDEDLLSPEAGRLIDAAKSRAGRPLRPGCTEAVAVLAEDGAIFTGPADGLAGGAGCTAAADAVAAAREAQAAAVVAAAVAAPDPALADVPLCPDCAAVLAARDPELPLVIKRKGRWVMGPLSALRP